MLQTISFKLLAISLTFRVAAIGATSSFDWTWLMPVAAILGIVSLLSSIVILRQTRSRSTPQRSQNWETQERRELHERIGVSQENSTGGSWELGEERVIERIHQVQSIQQFADTYRSKFCKDPQMIQLRILSMTWSLNLLQVYVQLRLCQNTNVPMLSPDTLYAQMTQAQDSSAVLQAERMCLKQFANTVIEPSAAIRNYQRCIILGAPGSGKTTLLKYLALRCARRELRGLSDLPIYIDLNTFVQSLQWQDDASISFSPGEQSNLLLTFAASQWDRSYNFPAHKALPYMQRNLEEGSALVLLDGLNETFVGLTEKIAQKSYERIINTIRDLAATYTKAFIVVTARTTGYRQHLALMDFTELGVLSFRECDSERFVNNWFKYNVSSQTSAEDTRLLIDKLQNPHLQALASHPLWLALLVAISQQESTLPQQRATIYKRCVDTLLIKWEQDQSHSFSPDPFSVFSKEDMGCLLKEVAWQFHLRGQRYFPRRELTRIIAQFLKTLSGPQQPIERILAEISTESGLLKEQAAGWYGFLHLTLQEYFVALAITESKEKYEFLLQHIHEIWWKEVLLLYAGLANDATPLLRDLWQRGGYHHQSDSRLSDHLFHRTLILAGQCLAVSTTAGLSYRSDIINVLFKVLISTPYRLTQQQIAATLAQMGERNVDNRYLDSGRSISKSINHRLLDDLTNDEGRIKTKVKMSIAQALGTYGNKSIVAKLVELLADEWIDTEVRICIAQTLRISGKQSAAVGMAKYLPDRLIDHDVRLHLAIALGDLIDDTLVLQVIPLINDQRIELDMRCAIIDALGTSSNQASIRSLQTFCAHIDQKRDFSLYWHTVIALAALGEYQGLSALLPLLADNGYSIDARLRIISGLAALRLTSLIPKYFTLLENEAVPWEVRVAIAVALEVERDSRIISSLLALLVNEQIDALVRAAVANVISTLGDSHLVQQLSELHIDQAENLSRCITTACARLGDESTAPALLRWLSHHEVKDITIEEALSMRDALAKLLGRLIKDEQMRIVSGIVDLARSLDVHMDVQQGIIALLPQIACEMALLPPRKLYIQHKKEPIEQEITSSLEAVLAHGYDNLVDTAHTALWEVKHYLSPHFTSTEGLTNY